MQYVFSDYMATGEGTTICILITMAYPDHEDYDESKVEESYIDEEGRFHWEMPPLKEGITPEVIALREFKEEFGDFFSIGAEVLEKDEFLKRCKKHLPDMIVRILNDEDMGNFKYVQRFHVNYA